MLIFSHNEKALNKFLIQEMMYVKYLYYIKVK